MTAALGYLDTAVGTLPPATYKPQRAIFRVDCFLVDSGVQSNYDAQFGKYTLIAKLATGGMGEIFLAKLSGMAGFEKLVVIKRLLPHLAEDEHFVTMLLDEARIAARLSHPNVCQVYDLGEVGGIFYIAMEFLEGVPCSQMLKAARRDQAFLNVGLAVNILQQTCAGLHHAHSLKDHSGNDIGLVHRDVSPSNLFATVSGAIKVLDFGVAKSQDARARTHTGALKGKYAYMSPEQVMAHDIDRRSDVFSLGIVLFELLTTRRLFWRDSEYKMFQAIAEQPIPDIREFRPDVPAALAEVANIALSRDVEKRYDSAEKMNEAMGAAMALSGGVASNATVAAYVRANFDAEIREQRELVVTAVSPHDQPTVADGCAADMGEHSREAALFDAPEIIVEESPDVLEGVLGDLAAEKARDQRGRGLFFYVGLAAIGVLAAIAGTFILGLFEGDTAQATGDVVIHQDPPVTKTEIIPPHADAGQEVTTSKDPPRLTPPAKVNVTLQRSKEAHSMAFTSQQGAAASRCVREYGSQNEGDISIHLDISADGSVTGARIKPASRARSKLGRCLTKAAKRTKFVASGSSYSASLPLRLSRKKK